MSAGSAPRRPATVTAAFALQLAVVAGLLVMIAVVLAHAVRYDGLIDQAARATAASRDEAAMERAGNLSGALMPAVPALVLAVWLGCTAVGLRRGSNVARILTLVGLAAPLLLGALFCLVGGVFGVLIELVLAGPSQTIPPDEIVVEDASGFYAELQRLDSGGWSIVFGVLGVTGAAVALLAAIATGVLLLTHTSAGYFRSQHPVSGPPYPAYWAGPAYPHPMPPPYPYRYPAAYGQPPFWYPTPAPPAAPPPTPGPVSPATPPPHQPPSSPTD